MTKINARIKPTITSYCQLPRGKSQRIKRLIAPISLSLSGFFHKRLDRAGISHRCPKDTRSAEGFRCTKIEESRVYRFLRVCVWECVLYSRLNKSLGLALV